MATHDTAPGRCPACDRGILAATNVTGDQAPTVGDLTVCIGCAAALRFDSDLQVHLLTEGDVLDLTAVERWQLTEAQNAVRTMRRQAPLLRECPECHKKGRARRIDSGPPPATFVCGECGAQWQDESP